MGGGHSSHYEPDWDAIEREREEAEATRLWEEEQRWFAEEAEREAAERWQREYEAELAAERAAAEAARRQEQQRIAEADARLAREVEELRWREYEAQRAAERAAQAAQEEAERMRRQVEAAQRAARIAQQEAEARARAEREHQERMRKELEEERERTRVAEAAARQAAIAARREEARRRNEREVEIQRARREQAAAEEAARQAAAEARLAKEEHDRVARQLKEGIQPVVMPTFDEIRAAKGKVGYKDGIFHFAVAGVAGSGKSSLINAVCGRGNQDPGAAPTGIVETTLEVGRYPDPNHADQSWYDVPGSGTLKVPDWQYFNSQGLYIFDCVIVLFNNRFTMTDQAILTNCRRFKIPTFIVRSKADQHIRNLMLDMGYDSDAEGETSEGLYKAAREQLIAETRRSVKDNLSAAELPDQRVYIVSHKTLLGIVRDKSPKKAIDELELLRDLYGEAYGSRRHPFGVANGAHVPSQSH